MTTNRPQQLLSNGSRLAAALVVAGFVSAVCAAAAHESRYAVDESSAAMSRGTIFVQLPTVEVVARRDAASAVTASNAHHAARTL
jgi:hypothetical protein